MVAEMVLLGTIVQAVALLLAESISGEPVDQADDSNMAELHLPVNVVARHIKCFRL